MYFAPISQATKYNYLDDKFQAAYKWLAETWTTPPLAAIPSARA